MTTHHPDARTCAEASELRQTLAGLRVACGLAETHGQLVAFGSQMAGYEAQQSTTPTCPTCRAEMAREKDGAA